MKVKAAGWAVIALVAAVVGLLIAATLASRTEPLRKLVVATLADRLDSDVELESFAVDPFPTVTIRGSNLVLRLRGVAATARVPPLIQIKSFTVRCGLFDLFRRPRRFRQVTLEGLIVNIPPGGLAGRDNPISGAIQAGSSDGASGYPKAPIVVEDLRTDDALLRIIPKREGKAPREFAIHKLSMQSLGYAQPMPFKATLTNPLPKGLIDASGTFGPWRKDDPSTTPVAGTYSFNKADLGTIDGLGGILDSTGQFHGQLERIVVKGETHSPDFSLDISHQPVPLDTKFQAIVDGTDGDTYLDAVDAVLRQTVLTAKGEIAGTHGVHGRTIKLHVRVHEGRIEDFLRLTTKSKQPIMVGRVALHTDLTLPPGKTDVFERLQLAGEFDVAAARFTNPDVSKKLAEMSRRARGLDSDDKAAGTVASELTGRFRLHSGTMTFTQLSFALPGASVQLQGTYKLRSEELNFTGTLRMHATISQAAGGGMKGFFLKLIDPLFKKKGAGALVPIHIRGTVEKPQFGVDVGRVFKG